MLLDAMVVVIEQKCLVRYFELILKRFGRFSCKADNYSSAF